MSYRIQLRRAPKNDWESLNPTLAEGEPGLETDTGLIKIGNGMTPWNSLPYMAGTSRVIKRSITGGIPNGETKTLDVVLAVPGFYELVDVTIWENTGPRMRLVTKDFTIEKDSENLYLTANRDITGDITVYAIFFVPEEH